MLFRSSEYGFGGATDSSFTSARAAQVNMIINGARMGLAGTAGAALMGAPSSFSDLGYFTTYGGSTTDSTQIKFLNAVAHPSRKPERTVGKSAGADYSLMTLTASMFLKASSGPRTPAEDPSKRNLTDVASGRSKPVSVIPVLAGGVNGVVTGSWLSAGLDYTQPALGVLTNDADNGSDDSNRSWYSSEGGTPFWRADTFFLLKEKPKPDKFQENPIKIVASSWAPMFCQAPYMTGENIPQDSDLDFSYSSPADNKAVYSQFRIFGTGAGSAGDENDRFQASRYGPRSSSPTLSRTEIVSGNSDVDFQGNVTIDVGSKSNTTREMITFGQMVHYGYANAATEITASLVDRVDVYTAGTSEAAPGMSGSIDTRFSGEIYDGSSGTPKNCSLHTQALKVASLWQGFNNASIPANLEHVYDASKGGVSQLSDFPDTCQSQYGSLFEPQSASTCYENRVSPRFGEFRSDFNALVASATKNSELRQPAGAPHPRYLTSGSTSAVDVKSVGASDRRYNETFQSLDTFTAPIVTYNTIGPTQPNGKNNSAATLAAFYLERGKGIAGDPTGINDATQLRPLFAPEPSYGALQYSPIGSGWSLIASPAYIASTTRLNTNFLTGSMAEDFARFGSFMTSSIDWQVDLGEKFTSAPKSTWLDAGLRRDLNIFLKPGQTHQGTNPGFADNFCGFTILTASTSQRPLESPGRESAALPLQANVYKRQYLNYRTDFKLDVPVRTDVPRSAEPPGYWTFTANNYRTEVGTFESSSTERSYLGYLARTQAEGSILAANSTVAADNRLFTAQRMLYAKRYHLRYSVVISEGGWNSGFMEGVKNYVRAVGAGEKISGTEQAALPLPGLGVFTAGPRPNGGGATIKLFAIDDSSYNFGAVETRSPYGNILASTEQSGSFVKEPTVDSMYVLDPADEIVVGVQPSLPGWNPGSGLPNNRHSSKYGIWDVSGSHTAGHAKAWDVDTTGAVLDNPYMNLEDPYEPCHGLTMLKSPSRVVLFGSFVRDNKPHDNSSTEVIGSDAIHEAIHYDNPVLDQFSIAGRDEYTGSSLEQFITGSILASQKGDNLQGVRGVAGRVGDGTITFNGSLKRSLRLAEESEVYFDTLLQDPVGIMQVQSGAFKINAGNELTVVNMHVPSHVHVHHLAQYYDRLEQLGIAGASGRESISFAFSHGWSDSFPFEPKYVNVPRMTSDSSFWPVQTNRVMIGVGASDMHFVRSDANYTTFTNESGIALVPGNVGSANVIYNQQSRFDLSYGGSFLPETANSSGLIGQHSGNVMGGIANMSNVANFSDRAIPNSTAGFGSRHLASRGRAEYRNFSAAMVGFGRHHGKYLDVDDLEFLGTAGTTVYYTFGFKRIFSFATSDHPAGFKFGYMNSDHLSPTAVFRSDRYGQFRDMLEPRLFSKTFSKEDELSPAGETEAAVSCIFVDRSGTPVEDATLTSCLNISTTMTASKPFIEGDTPRKLIINPDFLTIDPFSIDLPRLTDLI